MLEEFIAAVKRYDSMEKLRGAIFNCLRDGQDPFGLTGGDSWSDGVRIFYDKLRRGLHDLVKAGNIKTQEKKRIEGILMERLDQFEIAILSLIFDKEIFFTKTKYGNAGTLSELVGSMAVNAINTRRFQSPNQASGKIAELVMPHIEYDAIVSGELTFDDTRRFSYNQSLLGLLFSSRTDVVPHIDYWRNLQQNEDFIMLCYDVLKELGDRNAPQLIPKAVANYVKRFGIADLGQNFWVKARLRHEFGYPWSDFLKDSNNEFQAVFSSDLHKTSIRKPPETIKLFSDGSALILSSYTILDGYAEVGLVHVDGKLNLHSFRVDLSNPLIPTNIPKATSVLKMIREYQRITSQYGADLIRVKT